MNITQKHELCEKIESSVATYSLKRYTFDNVVVIRQFTSWLTAVRIPPNARTYDGLIIYFIHCRGHHCQLPLIDNVMPPNYQSLYSSKYAVNRPYFQFIIKVVRYLCTQQSIEQRWSFNEPIACTWIHTRIVLIILVRYLCTQRSIEQRTHRLYMDSFKHLIYYD